MTPRPKRSRINPTIIIGGAIAVVVLAALAVALIAGGDDDTNTATTTAAPSASTSTAPRQAAAGPLPQYDPTQTTDPAIGMLLPTLSGTDANGQPLTITADGTPKMIVFIAHWCPHCQREVPVIQDWLDNGHLPNSVELVSVATAIDPRRPNYPPQDWLAREHWTPPVLYDNDNSAATTSGLSAYPYFVAVDANNTVVQRATGELTPDQLDTIAQQLAP